MQEFMPFVLDIVIVLLFALQIFRGLRHGLLRTVAECISSIAAVFISALFSGPAAELVYQSFFAGRITKSIAESVLQAGSAEELFSSIGGFVEVLPESVQQLAESMLSGLQGSLSAADPAASQQMAQQLAQTVADSIVKPMLTAAISAVLFLVFFLVLVVVFRFVCIALGIFNHIPILGSVNSVLGGVFGAAKAALLVFVLLAALSLWVQGNTSGWITQQTIEQSFAAQFFYEHNPLLALLKGL